MIEIAALATSLVSSFLVPLVQKGVEGLTAELRGRTTEAAASSLVETAQKLWNRLRGEAKDGEEADVVDLFKRNPEMMKGAMEEVVRAMIARNPDLHKDASSLLETESVDGKTQWQLMGEIVGAVDARNANISGGNVAGVIYEAGDKKANP